MGLSRSILKSKWPIIIWALFTFGLHILPSEKIPQPPDWNISWDKIVHFILFAVLSFLLLALTQQPKNSATSKLILILFACLVYGLLMEAVQILVPGRQFHLLDLLADSTGAIAGLFVYLSWYKRQSS